MSINNKYNEEAIEKIRELAEDIDICMFLSDFESAPLNAAPMSTKKVDKQGNIWFLSNVEHDTVTNIQKSVKVQLIYGKPDNIEYLSLFGEARVVVDKLIIKDLYQKSDDSWFDGADDPQIRAIVVNPKEAQYWEPKSNKAVTLFKMAYGAVSGNKVDVNKQGNLHP